MRGGFFAHLEFVFADVRNRRINMNTRQTAVFLSLILCVPFNVSFAGDAYWPGWLGPSRDGWVTDFQPPGTWSSQPTKVWQFEVGSGYGSPIVVGDRVYQHARQEEQEVVWCFDLESGQTAWRRAYDVPFKMGGGGEWHGKGPKSCPVYADGRLFTLSITGDLSAWDAGSGRLLWRTEYGKEFEQNHPYWGVSTSPIVDEDRVVVHFGNDKVGRLVALNVETGKELWSQGKDGPSYSSPLLAEIDGTKQIVEWNHEALVGVENATGKLL